MYHFAKLVLIDAIKLVREEMESKMCSETPVGVCLCCVCVSLCLVVDAYGHDSIYIIRILIVDLYITRYLCSLHVRM